MKAHYLLLVALALLGAGRTASADEKTEWSDRDKDGKPETQVFYENGVVVKELRDLNGDGQADMKFFYEKGKRKLREDDRDYDGRADHWLYFTAEGALLRQEGDTNGDGKADRWLFYESPTAQFLEQDRNFDGKVDMRGRNENMLDRMTKTYRFLPVWKELDNDFDGMIDDYRIRGVQNPVPDRTGTKMDPAPRTGQEAAEAAKAEHGSGAKNRWDVEGMVKERQAFEEDVLRYREE